ncbi:methionyl-tRNA formyltransferase [Guggenheimella bovis]
MKLVFMGTPEYAVPSLKLLHEKHEILAVYTKADAPKNRGKKVLPTPVKEQALEFSIPVRTPKSLRNPEEIEYLRSLKPDFIIVIAYGLLLPKDVLEIAPCINAHGSLLPKYRGASPMQESILKGDDVTGVTTMLMNEGMDTGDILLKAETSLKDKDIETLHDELSLMSAELLLETIERFQTITPIKQDDSQATTCHRIEKHSGKIDWTKSANEIYRMSLAYKGWPSIETTLGGKRLKLTKITPLIEDSTFKPGEVLQTDSSGIYVQTGKGILQIEEMQPEGKKNMRARDFLNGHPIELATPLGE